MNILVDAIKLYNDFTFRQKVDKLDKQIAAEKDPGSITSCSSSARPRLRTLLRIY
jgi:hypothetical protein